jgi:chemotaxis protein methyltransferase CheR
MQLSATTFRDLRQAIHALCGLVISDDKEYLIRDRLGPMIAQLGSTSFEDLCRRLRAAPDDRLVDAVIDAVLTRETSFFRDAHVFQALKEQLFPLLAQEITPPGRAIRIWSAGTANGQEAYSLSMLACEYMAAASANAPPATFSILASDISRTALQIAEAGVYDAREIARGMSPSRCAQFFRQVGNRYQARRAVRSLVEFRKANLCQPFVRLRSFDLICCRNVMIYFDLPTRQRICNQFHAQLREKGWLLLGSAENLYGISTGFESIRFGETMLYRKK